MTLGAWDNSSVCTFSDGETAGATEMNSTFKASPPIGAILPWLKSYTNTPSLPSAWVECNGQVLADVDSPYNTQTIPDLNGDNRFLRGNSTSGGTGGEETHTLTVAELPAHSHTYKNPTISTNEFANGSKTGATGESDDSTEDTGSGTAHENRPPYYNVVWIMRIK